MNKVFLYITVSVTFAAIIFFGITSNHIAMGSMVIIFLALLVFFNLANFKDFAISKEGIKATMKQAEEVIDEIKQLAINLVEPMCRVIYISSNTFSFIGLNDQIEYVNKLHKSLLEIGVTDKKALNTVQDFNRVVEYQLYDNFVRNVAGHIKESTPDLSQDLLKLSEPNAMDMNKVSDIINSNKIVLSEDNRKCLKNYEHYVKNKSIVYKDMV